MTEFWDVYDKDRNFTGKTVKRGGPFEEGEFYVCCEVWILNSKNQMLLTQRHPDKKAGGQWEFTGGGVLAGESTLVAAMREVEEEIGIHLQETELELLDVYKHKKYFMDIYLVRKDLAEEEITLDPNEVVDFKWLSKEEIADYIASEKMVYSVGLRYNMFGPKMEEK